MENKHCCEIYKFSVMKTKHNYMYSYNFGKGEIPPKWEKTKGNRKKIKI